MQLYCNEKRGSYFPLWQHNYKFNSTSLIAGINNHTFFIQLKMTKIKFKIIKLVIVYNQKHYLLYIFRRI